MKNVEYTKRLAAICDYVVAFTEKNTYFLYKDKVGGNSYDLGFMHNAVTLALNALDKISQSSSALNAWDAIWIDIKADLDRLCKDDPWSSVEFLRFAYDNDTYLERYKARFNYLLFEASLSA